MMHQAPIMYGERVWVSAARQPFLLRYHELPTACSFVFVVCALPHDGVVTCVLRVGIE